MEKIYEHPQGYCQMSFEESSRIFVLKLNGKIPLEDYKKIFEEGTHIFVSKNPQYMLADLTQLLSSDPLGRAWLVTHFMPTAARQIRNLKIAIAKPQNVFQRFALVALLPAIEKFFSIKVFMADDYQTAYEWLRHH